MSHHHAKKEGSNAPVFIDIEDDGAHGGHQHGPNCNHDHDHGHSQGAGHSHGHSHEQSQGGHQHGPNCNHDHGDGHGHSHGDGHGHGHGHSRLPGKAGEKKASKRNKWLMGYGLEIKLFVYGVIVAGWIFNTFWFVDHLKGNSFDYWGSIVLMTFLCVLASVSYYICSNARPGNPTKNVPAHAGPQNQTTCKQCNHWKPERTHHCSTCGQCVLRMDHHCPWVCNCVGYVNHKSFICFCIYIGLSGLYYDYRGFKFLAAAFENESFYDLSPFFLIAMSILTVIILPVGLMVLGLAYYHIFLAMNNLTTLEAMGGNMRGLCDSKAKLDRLIANKYDRGFLANLCDFLGNTYFLWWFPTTPKYSYKGQVYEQVPTPTPSEMITFLRGPNAEESMEEKVMKPKNLAEVDLVNIFKIAEHYTSDKNIQFFDKMLEIGKRKDNTYKEPEAPVQNLLQANDTVAEEVNLIDGDTQIEQIDGDAVVMNGKGDENHDQIVNHKENEEVTVNE